MSQRRVPDASWVAVGVVLTVILAAAAYYVMSRPSYPISPDGPEVVAPTVTGTGSPSLGTDEVSFVRSTDAEEFKSWMAAAPQTDSYVGAFMGRGMMVETTVAMDFAEAAPSAVVGVNKETAAGMGGETTADRYSSTNVQVMGIDEPDIVKTDGSRIFYAPERRYWPVMRGMPEPMMIDDEAVTSKLIAPSPDGNAVQGALTVQALPIEDLEVLGQLDHTGQLLLSGDVLMVFDYEGVYGYDISDPAEASLSWQYEYDNDNRLEAARLKDGELYLVTRSYLNRNAPCPIEPLMTDSGGVIIPCGDVWHRSEPSAVDTTFSVVVINPQGGAATRSAAFAGKGDSVNVAMFEDSIYVTSGLPVDVLSFMVGFLNDNGDMVPAETLAHLNKVLAYDLSLAAKQAELGDAMERWLGSLDDDGRLRLENQISNRMADYWREHAREVGGTAVVKMAASDLEVTATGRVPGGLLNQFAIDEHNGNLRLAVTVGGRSNPLSWQFGIGRDQSVSDVYVLDPDLKIIGSAKGMGEGERIYSVRFLGDRGYVVTFKETDPFYVLDLSDPTAPSIEGELKIPGYSSYLHPIADDMVLGVGKEGSQVKLSLFDVSDPTDPRESAKYSLDEYWSDVLGTHHAFLQDSKHGVFFMPGSKGGYIFSYGEDELRIERAVSGVRVNRAVYINDYLYLISDEEITVLDERDWQEVGSLELR